MNGRVTVYSKDILRAPLLDSEDANLVVIRHDNGIPMIVMKRLGGDVWAISTQGDPDWEDVKIRFGIK